MAINLNFLRAAAIGVCLIAGEAHAGGIEVTAPWTRATVHGASVAVGYLTIVNKGSEADRLAAASADVAAKVEIHETRMEDGVMKMRALPDGVAIKPGESLTLKPGSTHLMLLGLKQQLTPGGAIHVTLTFAKAGPIAVTMPVQAVGATAPPPASGDAPSH